VPSNGCYTHQNLLTFQTTRVIIQRITQNRITYESPSPDSPGLEWELILRNAPTFLFSPQDLCGIMFS
jgi:hypothetical protein